MSESLLLSISSVLGSAVGFIGTVVLLVVSLTLVRKADERAGWLLAAGFALFAILALAWPLATFLIPRVTAEFSAGYAVVNILFTLVRVVALALEILGLILLAQTAVRLRAGSTG